MKHRYRHLILLIPWFIALIGYFGPWIAREPVSAALSWNAHDLFTLLRLLPEIETGTLSVNLQTLQLPLLGLALLLPILLARSRPAARALAAIISSGLAAMTLPPYPQIVTAWRTPGWRVPFWWAIGVQLCVLALACLGPRLAPPMVATRPARYWGWASLVVVQLAAIPPAATLTRLIPALAQLHAAPVKPGWGFWCCLGGFSVIGVAQLYQASIRGQNAYHPGRQQTEKEVTTANGNLPNNGNTCQRI